MAEYNQFIFSGTLVHPNIFRLRLIRAFLMRGLLRINFQLNSVWLFLGYTFRLLQFFNILNSSDFAHIPNLSFMDVVHNGENRFSISFFHLREISKQTLGNIKKTGLILSSESENMLIRGVVAAVRVVKIHSKSTPIVFLLYS